MFCVPGAKRFHVMDKVIARTQDLQQGDRSDFNRRMTPHRLHQLTKIALLPGVVAMAVWVISEVRTDDRRHSVVEITEKGPDGLPIIFWRIKQRDAQGVAELLDAGASIETPGFFNATPVITAASANSWEMVEFLLDRGADPRAADGSGFTLPWLAATSKIKEGTDQHAALQRVLPRLEQMGVMERIFTPDEAEELVQSGNWPPPELR